jgi:tetratricopeptide (TPR) repeat protein
MVTTLTLKRSETPLREASAWLLPGAEPEAWLNEVVAWPVPVESVAFYPIAGPAGGAPLGVLAVPAAPMRLPAGGRALPYGAAGPGFFMPIDGFFQPPLSREELAAMMRHPVMVFHPVTGLSGFDATDVRRAWDFLLPPEQLDEPWNRACVVDPLPSRLRSVRLVAPLSLETLFGEENGDIGSEPFVDLPPTKDEPRFRAPGRIASGAMKIVAGGLMGLASLVPRSSAPGAGNWVNDVENWARRKFAHAQHNLDRERNRELHRLLEMLEKNPSEGLRHAISLAALAHRGRATPSSQLGRRSLDFNLKSLGGSGAVDGWDIPSDIRTSLTTRYRESAHREASLGNFRRAACIFAELLGDFSAAAEMLKRGRYFQEAALLYRDRLNNETAAAECMAQGGLIEEAVAIYEKLGRWLEIAAIYEEAGSVEKARAALRKAVDAQRAAGDTLAAAQLLETRLNEPEEALRLLAETWPQGRQALRCLEERFALLERLHDHAATRELLEDLGRRPIPSALRAPLVGRLAQLFETLVDQTNRRVAAESARLHISALLAGRSLDTADELGVLRALTRLVPEDRLLKRDVTRFREIRIKPPQISATPTKPPALIRRIELQKGGTLSLPKVGKWLLAAGDSLGFQAVARRGETHLFFTRGVWGGAMQSVEWPDPAPAAGSGFLMTTQGSDVILSRLFTPLPQKKLPETDAFKWRNSQVGTPAWLPEDTVCVAAAGQTLWVVRVVSERVVLASYASGEFVYSRDVTDDLKEAGATGHGTTLSLDAMGSEGKVALGYGRHLLVMDGQRAIRMCELGGRVLALLGSPLPLSPGWVALLDRGAVFVAADTLEITTLDEQMEMPKGVFLGEGHLVLVAGAEGRVFHPQLGSIFPVASFPFPAGDWLALVPAAHPREFATCTAQGTWQRWQVPG